jgi:hypothetical protein
LDILSMPLLLLAVLFLSTSAAAVTAAEVQ